MDGIMMYILLIVSFFPVAEGQVNAEFKYVESCYSVGQTLTLEAVYTGSGTPSLVQWSYSAETGTNLIIKNSDCTVLGSVPASYPSTTRMEYKCPTTDSLPANTYRLTVLNLTSDELSESWGATFTPPIGAVPVAEQVTIPVCTGNNSTNNTTNYTSSNTHPSATVTDGPDNTDDIIIGASVGGPIIIFIVICGIICYCKRHKRNKSKTEHQLGNMSDFKKAKNEKF